MLRFFYRVLLLFRLAPFILRNGIWRTIEAGKVIVRGKSLLGSAAGWRDSAGYGGIGWQEIPEGTDTLKMTTFGIEDRQSAKYVKRLLDRKVYA